MRISGKIPPSDYQRIYVDLLDVNISTPLDSARLRKGKFHLHVPLSEPSFLLLKLDPYNYITILASPGEHIRITADTSFLPAGYQVNGSEESKLVKTLDDHLRRTIQKADSITTLYKTAMNQAGFDTLKTKLEDAYQKIIDGQRKFSIAFILDHMHDLASIKAIYQKIDDNAFVLNSIRDIQYLKILSDTLTKYFPELRITRALVTDFNREMSKYKQMQLNAMAQKSGTIGYLDIKLPDINGDTVKLSSLRGKYILLSFWASWCDQCIQENLEFKTLYKKYHSKGFDIYQVSLDNRRDAWTRAVRFDELPWINVSDLSYPNSPAANLYNVRQPPRNFLLDPKGDLIARDLHGRSLQIKLSQIFEP